MILTISGYNEFADFERFYAIFSHKSVGFDETSLYLDEFDDFRL